MEPTRELIDDIESERFARAKQMTPGERMIAGAQLFDMACRWAEAGIRAQHRGASDAEVFEILEERLRIAREMDDIPLPSFDG